MTTTQGKTHGAVVYCRCSPRPQDDKTSLAVQREACERWCREAGREVLGVYIDSKKSGTSERGRPELGAAMTHAAEANAMLVAYDLSRVARSTSDTFRIIEKLTRKGADGFSTVRESWINVSTPEGRVVMTFMAAMNQYFAELHGAKTREGLRHRAAKGLSTGGIPPYGSYYDSTRTRVLKDPECQEQIEWLCWRRSLNMSMGILEIEMNMRGIPCYMTRKGKKPEPSKWEYKQIQRVLNREYKQRVSDGKRFEPVIIDAFDRAMVRMLAAKTWPKRLSLGLEKRVGPPIFVHRALVPDEFGLWPNKATLDPALVGIDLSQPALDEEGYLIMELDKLREVMEEIRLREWAGHSYQPEAYCPESIEQVPPQMLRDG